MGEFWSTTVFYGAVVSLLGYEVGLLVKKRFRWAILNPLIIAVCCVLCINAVLGVDYEVYYAGGQYVSYLLTPATVALAIPLYRQISLLKRNKLAILVSIFGGVLMGGISVLMLVLAFRLDYQQYVTLMPKSVTTAIGMSLSQELGGVPAITAAIIILTGIWGSIIAERVFSWFKITNPVAQGLAIGTSAHAIGTTKAMEMGEVCGAMSSLAIAIAGVMTVVLAPVFCWQYTNGVALLFGGG